MGNNLCPGDPVGPKTKRPIVRPLPGPLPRPVIITPEPTEKPVQV